MNEAEAYAAYSSAFPEEALQYFDFWGAISGRMTLDGEFSACQLRKLADLLDAIAENSPDCGNGENSETA